MEIPFSVRLMSPARNALLLLGSSQESVPGMKVSYIARAYSSAAMVSLELIVTLLRSSTILPPCDHTTQWHQALASPTALPNAKPHGVPLAFSACNSLRKDGVSVGISLNPAASIWLRRYVMQPPRKPSPTAIQRPSRVQ